MAGKLILILLIFILAAGIDFPGMIKGKRWRELIVYSIFMLLGLTLLLMQNIFRIDIGLITDWIIQLF